MVELGYLEMPEGVDYGYYGNLTKDAVRRYQIASKIKVDGIVGDQTWKSLGLGLEGVGDSYTLMGTYQQYSKVIGSNPLNNPVGSVIKTKPSNDQSANGYYPEQGDIPSEERENQETSSSEGANSVQSSESTGAIVWIKDKWNQFSEWSEDYTLRSTIEIVKMMLPDDINEDSPDYTQMIVDRVLEDYEIQEMCTKLAMGTSGGVKIVGNISKAKGISSLIKNDSRLINAAKQMGKNETVQQEANNLIKDYLKVI